MSIDEIILINEKQVAGMKPLTLQQQLKGMNMHIFIIKPVNLSIIIIIDVY